MAGKSDKVGYSNEFVNLVEDGKKCTLCTFVLRNPFQTECGHRFCRTCIDDVIKSGSKMCPVDNTVLSMKQIFSDKFCNREIMQLQCFCSSKARGCNWTGALEFIEDHQAVCPKFIMPCPKGCLMNLPRSEIPYHFAQACPHADASCPMVGQCEFEGSRLELREHLAETSVEHTRMVQDKIGAMQSDIAMVQTTTTNVQQQQEVLEEQVANQHAELATLRQDLILLRTTFDRYVMSEVEGAQHPLSRRPQEPDSLDIKERLRKLEELVKELQSRERQALGRSGQDEAVIDLKKMVDLKKRVVALEHHNTLSAVQLATHDFKLSMLETTSYESIIAYDGIFLWKIDNYGRFLNEAMMGKRSFIDSQPFYVGRYGYKVCGRAYLNGDGLGKNTHLSLFLVVKRGEYDALLPWPFQQKVSFKLIDQSQDQHIVDSFQPNLQQPPNGGCIATGCPLFMPRFQLNNGDYIKEDTIFVKITVDSTCIPRGF